MFNNRQITSLESVDLNLFSEKLNQKPQISAGKGIYADFTQKCSFTIT